MYQLVYGGPVNHIVLAQSHSYHEVADRRVVSGDLVVWVSVPQVEREGRGGDVIEQTTTIKRVVQSEDWLFPWEKTDISCYARRMQKRWTY